MPDFTQFYISPALHHFKKEFQEKWNLKDYYDVNLPSIFFGMYGQEDAEYFLNHRGPKLMIWGGNDMHPPQLNLFKQENNKGNTYTFATPGEMVNTFNEFNINYKIFYLTIKDYSNFTPTPLGENIYVYLGQPNNPRLEYFEYNNVIEPLIYTFGEDRIKWVKDTKPLQTVDLINQYYNDCFVYVKPNKRGGNTTMWELAHMGRKTIGKGQQELPNFIEYNDVDHLIDLILQESQHIGQIKEDIASKTKDIFIGEEWLTLEYWNK
jgi:hypothetical protein